MKTLCEKAKELLSKEPNICSVCAPITVCLGIGFLNFRFVVTFMVSITICENSSLSEAVVPRQITCLWVIMSIAGIIALNPFCCSWH